MAYTPTNWQTGDVITAEKLNKLEGGVADSFAPFIVNVSFDPDTQEYSTDKTYAEVYSALENKNVFYIIHGDRGLVISCTVAFVDNGGTDDYIYIITVDSVTEGTNVANGTAYKHSTNGFTEA